MARVRQVLPKIRSPGTSAGRILEKEEAADPRVVKWSYREAEIKLALLVRFNQEITPEERERRLLSLPMVDRHDSYVIVKEDTIWDLDPSTWKVSPGMRQWWREEMDVILENWNERGYTANFLLEKLEIKAKERFDSEILKWNQDIKSLVARKRNPFTEGSQSGKWLSQMHRLSPECIEIKAKWDDWEI
jgi:hypothetical protein